MSEEENVCLSPGLRSSSPLCFLSEHVVDASKGPFRSFTRVICRRVELPIPLARSSFNHEVVLFSGLTCDFEAPRKGAGLWALPEPKP